MRSPHAAFLLATALLASGCILKDDVVTFHLRSDGGSDVVIYADDIRSSKEGAEAVKEEAEWLSDFERGADDRQAQLKRANARGVSGVLLRDARPFAAAVRGSFDSIDGLAGFFDLNKKDSPDRLTFRRDGDRRVLAFHIERSTAAASSDEGKEAGSDRCVTYPIMKFVPVGGTIVEASGFAVSGDSASAVLDLAALARSEKKGGAYELSLVWKVK